MLGDNPTQGNPKVTWQIWGQKLLSAQLLKQLRPQGIQSSLSKGRILPKLCLVKLHCSRQVSQAMMKLVRNESEPQETSSFGGKVHFGFTGFPRSPLTTINVETPTVIYLSPQEKSSP